MYYKRQQRAFDFPGFKQRSAKTNPITTQTVRVDKRLSFHSFDIIRMGTVAGNYSSG